MSAKLLDDEMMRYLAMAADDRWKWLANLLFALTQFARGTYTIDGPGLQQPHTLRAYNELLHRIASQLRSKARLHHGMPDDVFARALAEEIVNLGINVDALVGMLK